MKDNSRWIILITVIVGTFLGRLDQTIVGLALPKIIADFSITVSQAGWISTAYILANAVFVPIWGKLGDTTGRKRVYIIGFVMFIAASAFAGFAWNLGSMLFFRIIQAIAGSADYPTAMAIIAFTFRDGKERAQALGIWSSAFAAAAVMGPLLGGPLIDNFGWRAVFLVNIPVGLIGLAMAWAYIPESTGMRAAKFDWWGAITLGGALSALVLVLDKGTEWGWLSGSSLVSYAAIIGFGIWFYFIERSHPEPVVDLKFFRDAAFVGAISNNFIAFMGLMGSVFLIPIFAQTFLGLNATQTGMIFLPMAAGMMLGSPIGGRLTGVIESRYVIAFSTALAGVGLFMFSGLDARSTIWSLVVPLFVMAFGLGLGMAQRTGAVAALVPPEEMGVASSILALARNIAGAFGIAIFGTILNNATENKIFEIASSSSLYVHTPAAIQQFVSLIELKAQIAAYDFIFIVAGVMMLVGAAVSLWLKVPERKMTEEEKMMAEA